MGIWDLKKRLEFLVISYTSVGLALLHPQAFMTSWYLYSVVSPIVAPPGPHKALLYTYVVQRPAKDHVKYPAEVCFFGPCPCCSVLSRTMFWTSHLPKQPQAPNSVFSTQLDCCLLLGLHHVVLTSKNVPRKNMGQNSRVFPLSRNTILWSLLFNTCKQLYFVQLYSCLL